MLDHCTIAPTRYLVPLVVHVMVTGTVFAHLGCEKSFLWHSTALQWLYPVPGWVDGELRNWTTLQTRQSSGVRVTPMSKQWCKVSVHSPTPVTPVPTSRCCLLNIITFVTSANLYAEKKEEKKLVTTDKQTDLNDKTREKRTTATKIYWQRVHNNASGLCQSINHTPLRDFSRRLLCRGGRRYLVDVITGWSL